MDPVPVTCHGDWQKMISYTSSFTSEMWGKLVSPAPGVLPGGAAAMYEGLLKSGNWVTNGNEMPLRVDIWAIRDTKFNFFEEKV